MKSGIIHAPFTMSQGNFPRMIVSPVEVTNPKAILPGEIVKLRSIAQWDSGADYCIISSELAKALRLEVYGEVSVNQVEGCCMKHNSYMVNLILPNGIYFNDVLAVEDDHLKKTGVDFLIGLSVINDIDFALTHNEKGESVLSISYPADRLIDFCRNQK